MIKKEEGGKKKGDAAVTEYGDRQANQGQHNNSGEAGLAPEEQLLVIGKCAR